MKRFNKFLRTGILTLCIAATAVFPAFADGMKPKLMKNTLADLPTFPFELSIETDSVGGRLCYTGSGSKFREGTCITPDAEFALSQVNPEADINNLKIDVVVLYYDEENKKSLNEQVCGWDYGQLSTDTNYSIIPDDVRDELDEKGRLYSGYDRSLQMKLTYKDDSQKEEKMYFYVATYDELSTYSED